MTNAEQNSESNRLLNSMQRGIAFFTSLREFIVSVTVTIVAVSLIVIIIRQVTNTSVLITPIQVPQRLIDNGFTPEVTSRWILDSMVNIQAQAETVKDSQMFVEQWQQFDMEMPGSGFSVQSIGQVLRESLGIQQLKISGEVIATENGYFLRMRVSGKASKPISARANFDELDSLFKDSAEKAVQQIDPFIYAAYLYANKDYDQLKVAIEASLRSANSDDQKFAYNLQGNLANDAIDPNASSASNDRSDYQTALAAYEMALKIDPEFAITYYNRSNAHFKFRDYLSAWEDYQKAVSFDDKLVDDKRASVLLSLVATTFDNTKTEQKKEYLQQAIKLDPDNFHAQKRLAIVFYKKPIKNYEKAEELFAEAAKKNAEDHELFWYWGMALKELKECEQAKSKHNIAFKLRPDFGGPKLSDNCELGHKS